MERKAIVLLIGYVFLSFVHKSSAVECYICGGLTALDFTCEDPFEAASIFKYECQGSCAKYKGQKDETQLVWRTCTDEMLQDECIKQTKLGVDVTVCYCNANNCNTATSTGLSTLAAMGVALTLSATL